MTESQPLLRFSGKKSTRYEADDELKAAVNAALTLEMPLLLTGEPGTGKTSLADAVAEDLELGEVLRFYTTSESQARDVLYQFDHVLRFFHAQSQDPQARDPGKYVRMQALGEAIRSPTRRVVLIDEVDKAPRDFPNSLLHELDQMEFTLQETGERFKAAHRPVVIITNNAEHELPDPFLRRCIFHHITFPNEERLQKILTLHLGGEGPMGQRMRRAGLKENTLQQLREAEVDKKLVSRFLSLRETPGLEKKPGTSELLHWAELLLKECLQPSLKELEHLQRLGERLERLLRMVPFPGALVKLTGDFEKLTGDLEKLKPRHSRPFPQGS